MTQTTEAPVTEFGEGLAVGSRHYRAWVGPPEYYDLIGALQFNVMTCLGLREYHKLLDIGCGSLRAGRLFIMYLRKNHYYGLDPESWVIQQAVEAQLGSEFLEKKSPAFSNSADFSFESFGTTFDYILAHSIFTHASQQQIRRCLVEARRVITRNSLFVATFDESEQNNYEGNTWVYPGIAEYTRAFISSLVTEAGFTFRFLNFPHPWGQTWLAMTDPGSPIDLRALDNARHFAPNDYLTAHIPAERNETIRKLGERSDAGGSGRD